MYVVVNWFGEVYLGEYIRIMCMLISVVFVFIICQFFIVIMMCYIIYLEFFGMELIYIENNYCKIVGNVVNIFILLNVVVNFILYFVMSMKFRKVFQ